MKKVLVVSLLVNLAFAALFFARCEDGSKKERVRIEKEIQAAEDSVNFYLSRLKFVGDSLKSHGPSSVSAYAIMQGTDFYSSHPVRKKIGETIVSHRSRLDSLRRSLEMLQ